MLNKELVDVYIQFKVKGIALLSTMEKDGYDVSSIKNEDSLGTKAC